MTILAIKYSISLFLLFKTNDVLCLVIFNSKIMHTLWKKEGDTDSIYVDPFAGIGIEYRNDMQRWNNQLNTLKSDEVLNRSTKSNKAADEWMQFGHTAFAARNWCDAANAYSRALCFAKPGTIYEGLAHGNRGLSYFQLGLYHNALVDFELAAKKMCPDQFLNDIHDLRAECQKLASKKQHRKRARAPKMKLPADKQFPCMANVLEIKGNKDYGRCVIAKKDIEVGQTLFVAEVFASVIVNDEQQRQQPQNWHSYCYTCQRTEMNFIPCVKCSDVMFCSDDCASYNSAHKVECQTSYHHIDDIGIKFIIQSILVAIEIFPNVDQLIKFVESCTADRGCDVIPKSAKDSRARYGIILKLAPAYNEAHLFRAYQAFSCILLIPKVRYLFDTDLKQRFLMHLIVHHTIIMPKNAFLDVAEYSHQHTVKYLFDVLSIVNHSCAPNMHFSLRGKCGYCVVVRPIKRGDQVFINYLGEDVHMPIEQRRFRLKASWDFECKCDKCDESGQQQQHGDGIDSDAVPVDYAAMKADPALKYVIRNYNPSQFDGDENKRNRLKKQCMKFLKSHGHLPWTAELDFVINCFVSV